jgi:hypothetical protein
MVVVPNIVSDTPALRKNPIFLYYQDTFQKPAPFRSDVAVPLDDVWDIKINGLDAHVSQFYEWLPYVDNHLGLVPGDPAGRKKLLSTMRIQPVTDAVRKTLVEELGEAAAAKVQHVESFELCEYGRRPSIEELRAMFPLK